MSCTRIYVVLVLFLSFRREFPGISGKVRENQGISGNGIFISIFLLTLVLNFAPSKQGSGHKEKANKQKQSIIIMERIVRILNQSQLVTRQYMDKKTGEQKVINSVILKLSDGIDTFLGEITGEKAVNCPKYDPQYLYRVQCSMVVREWNSQQTGEAMQATTIYVDKINLV